MVNKPQSRQCGRVVKASASKALGVTRAGSNPAVVENFWSFQLQIQIIMKKQKRPSNAHQKSVDRVASSPVQERLPPQRPSSAPPTKPDVVINDSAQHLETDSNQYLPSFIEKTQALITICDDEALNKMKGIHELRQKVNSMLSCLRSIANLPNKAHNKGIYKLLTSSSDICDQIRNQIETYTRTDAFTRLFKEGSIRKKLGQLQEQLNTNVNLIELTFHAQSNYFQNCNLQSNSQMPSNSMFMPGEQANQSLLRQEASPCDSFNNEFGQNQLIAQLNQQWNKKLAEFQEKIETFNKPQIPPPHNVQQTLANDNQRKEKQRRQKEQRQKDEQSKDPAASREMEAGQQKQQQQRGEQMCIQADKLFFGFGSQPNKEAAISLYEESASLGCSKAMLALAAIYEISNPQKSYEYYDLASDDEPYALFKLGEFMEKMNFQDHQLYALQTYKKSA